MFRGADQEEWPSFEGFQGMSNREETPRADRLGGLYISSDLGTPRDPSGGAGNCCWGEGRFLIGC